MTQNKLIIIIGIIGLTALTGGGYYVYNYLENTPQKVFTRSVNKLFQYKSLSLSLNSKLDFASKDLMGDQKVEFLNLPLKKRVSIILKLNSDLEGGVKNDNTAFFSAMGDVSFSSDVLPFEINSDYFVNEKALYLKLKDTSYLSMFLPPQVLNKISNKWIKFDYKTLLNYGAFFSRDKLSKNSENNFLKLSSAYDILEKRDKIENAIWRSGVLIVKDKGTTEFNGMLVRRFLVSINKEKIVPLLKEINQYFEENYKISESDLQELENQLKGIEKIPEYEVLIDKSENIRKITLNYELKDKKLTEPAYLNLEITLDNYNKDFNLEEPKDYVDFSEILGSMSFFAPSAFQQLQQGNPNFQLPFGYENMPFGGENNQLSPNNNNLPLFQFFPNQ